MKCSRAFTLIEMVIVVGIILILLTLALPSTTSMWRQSQVQNADQQIGNLLKVARARSNDLCHFVYGLLFYVDPSTNKQVVVFVDHKMVPNLSIGETWPDVCDRIQVDTKSTGRYIFHLHESVRLTHLDFWSWEQDEILNEDYRSGKQRNFFLILFQRGFRASPRSYILYDEDENEDGLGDITQLVVSDTVGKHGGTLDDIVSDIVEDRLIIDSKWGFSVYDETIFKELRPDFVSLTPFRSFGLTPFAKMIQLDSS